MTNQGLDLGIDRSRKLRIVTATSAASVSSAKCPVSRNRTSASGMSSRYASAPARRKNGSFLPKSRAEVADECGNLRRITVGAVIVRYLTFILHCIFRTGASALLIVREQISNLEIPMVGRPCEPVLAGKPTDHSVKLQRPSQLCPEDRLLPSRLSRSYEAGCG